MSPLEGRRVLVTGGAGMIGSTIVDQLIAEGVREIVIVDNLVRGRMDNLSWALANGPVTFVEGDIGDRALIGELMGGIDVLFHQAAIRITQCAEDPRLALEVLVDGTFNVLEAAQMAGVEKVVAASSASVYGQAELFPTLESHHPYGNRTFYGAAKVFNEGMLRSFTEMYGLPYVALRYFNVYGPRMDIHGFYTEVLVRWMERIAAGEPPLVFGDGSEQLDLVYIDDVARSNILAAKADVADRVFNVGSGRTMSLLELCEALLLVMDSDLRPEMREARNMPAVFRRQAGVEAAREELGFASRVEPREGLQRLVDWWRSERTPSPAGTVSGG